jgi:hypothetical protein
LTSASRRLTELVVREGREMFHREDEDEDEYVWRGRGLPEMAMENGAIFVWWYNELSPGAFTP